MEWSPFGKRFLSNSTTPTFAIFFRNIRRLDATNLEPQDHSNTQALLRASSVLYIFDARRSLSFKHCIAVRRQIARLDIETIRAHGTHASGLWVTKATCFGTATKVKTKIGTGGSYPSHQCTTTFRFTTRNQRHASTPVCCSYLTGIVDETDP